jgi:translation initiation factor 2 alpha subunit (eIF-2alpha)
MEVQDIVKGWKTKMKRHAGLKKAHSLVELAMHSVGNQQAHDAYKLHLEQLLEEFDLATTQLERIEKEVTDVLKQTSVSFSVHYKLRFTKFKVIFLVEWN